MFKITEQDILKRLAQDNPWWLHRDGLEASQTVEFDFADTPRAYFAPFKKLVLNWKIRRSVILMGPRRVGKTVMLRQLLRGLLKEGFPPQNILFASIDTPLYSGMSLELFVDFFAKQTGHVSSEQRIVVFDEIQYLKDWEVHLKVLTEMFPNTRFVASGSAAAALKLKSNESGAGRFTDFFLPPLTFAEFLAFRNLEQELIYSNPDQKFHFETTNIDALNAALVDYLNFGGYPESALNPAISQNTQRHLGKDIVEKVLLRDLPSLYGIQDVQELNRLFTMIAYHSGREISLEDLSKQSGVSKNTISRYLEYLEAAFLIIRVHRVDDSGKKFKRARQFKVYLTNPSMRAALFSPLETDDEAMGYMVETAIFSQWFHAQGLVDICYARWKSGRKDLEVDLVRLNQTTLQPSKAWEIKWSDRFIERPKDMNGLIEFAKKHRLNTVDALTRSKPAEKTIDGIVICYVPCALRCYQIGRIVLEILF